MRLVAVGLALLLLLALLVHTPPMRRAVLRRAIATAAARLNVRLQADGLTYNLLSLSAALTGVQLSAAGSDAPFLTADSIRISIPRAALFGPFALDRVRLENARVAVIRFTDGTSNLPAGSYSTDGEPSALPLQRLEIAPLEFSYTDAANDLSVSLPHVNVDIGADEGTLRLDEPGLLRQRGTSATIDSLASVVAFDGRALRLSDLRLQTSEGTVQADGTLGLLVEEPRTDLALRATSDLTRLLRWGGTAPVAQGALEIDANVSGPFSSLIANGTVRSPRVSWEGFTFTNASADFRTDADRLEVSRVAAATLDGDITATVTHEYGSAVTRATADWIRIDVVQLLRVVQPASTMRPAARASGRLELEGAGDSPADWTIRAGTRLDAQSARRGEIPLAGTITLDVANGAWQLASVTTVAVAPVVTNLRGNVDRAQFGRSSVAGTIRLGDSDVPDLLARLRAAGIADLADGTVSGGRINASADLTGTLERPHVRMSAAARELVAGKLFGIDLDITAEGTLQRLAVDAQLRHGDANTAHATGTVWPQQERLETQITAALRNLPALLTDPSVRGAVQLDAVARGRFDALTATGTAAVQGAAYADYELGAVNADIELTPAEIRVDVTAPELSTRANALVARTESRQAALEIDVADADLTRLLRGSSAPMDFSGRVSLTARGSGPLSAWKDATADLVVSRLDARAGNLPVTLESPMRASYDGAILTVSNLEANVGETRLSVTGSMPATPASQVAASDALRALLTGDAAQVLAAAAATGLLDTSEVSARGPIALLARITGSLEAPVLAADLDVSGGELTFRGIPAVQSVELRAQVADGAMELLSATARWQDARVSATGRLPLRLLDTYLPPALLRALPGRSGLASVTARAEAITPAVLSPFLDAASLAQIDGVIDASLHLESSSLDPAAVMGEARLDRLDVRLAGLPVTQREPTRIAFADGVARVAAWDWTGQGATLAVQGDVRLIERQAALLAAGQIDLRTLAPFISDTGLALSGTVAPRVSIIGALDDPRVDGELALTDGEIRLREPRVITTNLNAFALMTPSGGRTTNLSGTVNGGALTGTATLTYGQGLPWTARLNAAIAGMGLEFPEGLRSELNADLALALRDAPAGPGGDLTGLVTITRSAYREPLAVITGLLAGLRADRLGPEPAAADGMAERLALNVRLLTDTDVIVDNNLARLELGGDLRVIGTAAAPSLSGRAQLREGGQLFLGTNVYTIRDGTIDFTNPLTIEPDLNIQATTRAGGYDIDLSLTGTPETLNVELDAPGSTLGQADLTSLLLTGRLYDEAVASGGQIVGEQVVGYLTGDVLGLAGRAVGLDTIRLGGPSSSVRRDPSAVAAEADPTSRLTFGKSFRDTVEITFSQSLRNSASTWIVDYQPFRQVDLRLVSRDDTLRTYEFTHDVAIGGSQASTRSRESSGRVRIGAMAFTGDSPLPEAELRRTAGIEPGDRFDVGDWLRARDRLEAAVRDRGFLEARVTATRQEQGNTVDLLFAVESGPATAIAVDGFTLAAQTRAAIEDAWSQSVFDDFLREEAAAIVREALTADGFLEPRISVALTANQTKTMTIAVAAGTQARGRRIGVASDDLTLARELEQWIAEGGFEDLAWRDPEALRSLITRELQTRGYLDARVTTAPPELEGADALLVVTVAAGPRYSLGEIVLPPDSPIAADLLRDAIALDIAASYDPAAADAARERLVRTYRRAGFSSARVEVRAVPDHATRSVRLSFTADAGRRDVLRTIEVRGARSVGEDVITGALDLEIGEPLAADAWLQARSRVFDTSLFRRVDVAAEPLEEAAGDDGAERPMRMVVTVEEWPALRVRYGLQVSEERPETSIDGRELAPGLSANITRRTLFGRAITLGAAAEYQPRERLGRIFANAPTLAGLPIESLLTLETSRERFTEAELVTNRKGISWEQRLRIGNPFHISYSYRFEKNRTYETGTPDPFVGPFDLTVNVARISAGAVFDTRDDPTDATRGSLFSFNLEHAPPTLGSQVRFLRQVSQAYRFQRWGRVVFASAARLGLAKGHDGQVVIPSERFYAGGAHSVRGVADDSLGPRDFDDTPAGGEALVVLNQEARFPIAWRFRGVGFVDAGTVFDRPSSIDLSQLVISAGAGLRITTPVGLLRVDFARPLRGASDESGRWTFGIGQAF